MVTPPCLQCAENNLKTSLFIFHIAHVSQSPTIPKKPPKTRKSLIWLRVRFSAAKKKNLYIKLLFACCHLLLFVPTNPRKGKGSVQNEQQKMWVLIERRFQI